MLIEWRWTIGVADRCHHLRRRVIGDIDKCHACALRGELAHMLGADAAGATRNEHDAVPQARIDREAVGHGTRSRSLSLSITVSTIASGGGTIDTTIGCSASPGSSNVANWLSS